MRFAAPATGRLARSIAGALLLSAAAGLAWSAPDQPADAMLQLLVDKALLAPAAGAMSRDDAASDKSEPGLIRQVHDRASEMVVAALSFVGVRYRRGGTSAETGFDCSGFTRHVFETSLGLVLPRRADEQAAAPGLVKVSREDLKPGDLVFFDTMRRTFSHVGIYIGDNRFIHAPSHGKDVRTDDLSFAYWAKRFNGARRAELPAEGPVAAAPSPSETTTR